MNSAASVRVAALSFEYPDGARVLNELSLQVDAGERVGHFTIAQP